MDIDTEHGMAQRGEAVAWIHAASGEVLTHHPQEYGRAHEDWIPLYTAPPSAPVGVDDEDIARVFMSLRIPNKIAAGELITPEDWFDFGRGCAALARQPAAIPRLANCGRYTATDNTGQHYYLNHANTWQAFQGEQPAAVDGACVWAVDVDSGAWDGACGAKWQFTDGGPVENDMRHCPQCGKRVATQHQEPTT